MGLNAEEFDLYQWEVEMQRGDAMKPRVRDGRHIHKTVMNDIIHWEKSSD